MDWVLELLDRVNALGILAVAVPICIFLMPVVIRVVIGRKVDRLFGGVSRFALDKPLSAATLASTPTDGMITLRQILNGQLGQSGQPTAPADERIKVLEELHAQGGISADKLAKLKAAIAAGN